MTPDRPAAEAPRPHRLLFDCPRGTAAALAAAPADGATAQTALRITPAGLLEAETCSDGAEMLLAHDWRGAAELRAWFAPDPPLHSPGTRNTENA